MSSFLLWYSIVSSLYLRLLVKVLHLFKIVQYLCALFILPFSVILKLIFIVWSLLLITPIHYSFAFCLLFFYNFRSLRTFIVIACLLLSCTLFYYCAHTHMWKWSQSIAVSNFTLGLKLSNDNIPQPSPCSTFPFPPPHPTTHSHPPSRRQSWQS